MRIIEKKEDKKVKHLFVWFILLI